LKKGFFSAAWLRRSCALVFTSALMFFCGVFFLPLSAGAVTISSGRVLPESVEARMQKVRAGLEELGYEKGSTDTARPGLNDDFKIKCRRYAVWFTKSDVVRPFEKASNGESYGEETDRKVRVTILYPGEDQSADDFRSEIKKDLARLRDHHGAIDSEIQSGENYSYSEEIERKEFTNAPDGNYQLEQDWFRILSGPAEGGWTVREGRWSFFYQPWKELEEYNLNAEVRMYGEAEADGTPFAFEITSWLSEDTNQELGGQGKKSADLSNNDIWEPLDRTAKTVLDLLLAAAGDTDAPDQPAADAPEPGLYIRVSASPTVLPADGGSTSEITVSTYEVTEKDRRRVPLSGKAVGFSIDPVDGKTPGRLSTNKGVTDSDGTASVTFTSPDGESLEGVQNPRALVVVESPELGRDDVTIQLETFAPLVVKTEHAIFPAGPEFENRLTFTFGAPGEDRVGGEVEAVVTVSGEHGRLSARPGEEGTTKLTLKATPGAENNVYYHWTGEQPEEHAFDETVTVEIPSMGYTETVAFSVGVDLAITGGGPLSPGTMFPGLFVPFAIYIHDRFHEDADLGALFKAFGPEPSLSLVQTGYQPLPAMDESEDFYTQLAAHVQGVVQPGDMLAWDVITGDVRKAKDGGWILVWKDYEGEGLNDHSFPGLVTWRRGTYELEARFDPHWNGDAAEADHVVKLAPLSIKGKGKSDVQLESFMIPTLKSWLAIFPAGETALMTVDVAVQYHKTGDMSEAAYEIGKYYALDFLGSKLTEKFTGKLGDALEKHVWGSDRGKWLQDRMRTLVAKANEGVKGLEKMTDAQIDQCIEMGKESLAGYMGSSMADTVLEKFNEPTGCVPQGVLATPAWADENLTLALAPLGSFLGGYDAGYVLLVEKHAKPEIVSKGRVLEPAPGEAFAYREETQRLYESGKWTAVILNDDETVKVSVTGDGDVRACLVGPKGVQAAAIGSGSPLGPVVEVSSSGFSAGQPASPDKSDGKKAEITGSGVRLRDDHGLEGKVIGALDKGDVVEVLEKWTAPSDMAIIREDCTGMFEDRKFHFKKGMGVHLVEHEFESEEVIVGVMQNGEMVTYGLHIEYVEIPGEQTWYLIRTDNGLEGWAYGDFVKVR